MGKSVGELIDQLEKLGRHNSISFLNTGEGRIEHISIYHKDNLDGSLKDNIADRKSNEGKETTYYIL